MSCADVVHESAKPNPFGEGGQAQWIPPRSRKTDFSGVLFVPFVGASLSHGKCVAEGVEPIWKLSGACIKL